MAGKKAGAEANLISDEDPEYKTDEAGGQAEVLSHTDKAPLPEGKSGSHRHGDQDHAEHGADPKNQQISQGPCWILNGAEDEKSDGGRTGETMDNTHRQGTQSVVNGRSAEPAVEPVHRCLSGMAIVIGVGVDVITVRVIMRGGIRMRACGGRKGSAQVANAERDEHEADREFHGKTDAGRQGDAKKNKDGADSENGESVTDAPSDTDERGTGDFLLTRDDGANSDDMIGIGGVPDAKHEADGQDSE